MSVLVDHELRSHPKWLALTDTQRARLIELWMWIDEQSTDGRIPDHIPKAIGIRPKDLTRLEELAWVDRNGNGWTAHDWHDMNPPLDPEAREAWFRDGRSKRRAKGKTDRQTRWQEKPGSKIYTSRRWRQVRADVFERDGGLCIDCGNVTTGWNADHEPPVADLLRDGKDPYDLQYIHTRCHSCHSIKTGKQQHGAWEDKQDADKT